MFAALLLPPVLVIASPHPSCLSYIRQTEETLFQAETAIKTGQTQLRKLQKRVKVMETLAAEGAVSRQQKDRAVALVTQTKKEIEAATIVRKQAEAQIEVLNKRPHCNVS